MAVVRKIKICIVSKRGLYYFYIMLRKVTKLFICLIPLIVYIWLMSSNDFRRWKEINLILRQDISVATLTKNPFNELWLRGSFTSKDDFETHLILNDLFDRALIEYKYTYKGTEYTDSLYYKYFGNDEADAIQEYLALFSNDLGIKPIGTKFRIYSYNGVSLPFDAVNPAIASEGIFRLITMIFLYF